MQNSTSLVHRIMAGLAACAVTAFMFVASVSVPVDPALYTSQVLA